MDVRRSLGKRIRLLRNSRKLTQEKLAEMTELSVTFIGTTERGRNCPSIKTCQKIADVLHVPLWELFTFVDWSGEEKLIVEFASRLRSVDREKLELIIEIGETILRKSEK